MNTAAVLRDLLVTLYPRFDKTNRSGDREVFAAIRARKGESTAELTMGTRVMVSRVTVELTDPAPADTDTFVDLFAAAEVLPTGTIAARNRAWRQAGDVTVTLAEDHLAITSESFGTAAAPFLALGGADTPYSSMQACHQGCGAIIAAVQTDATSAMNYPLPTPGTTVALTTHPYNSRTLIRVLCQTSPEIVTGTTTGHASLPPRIAAVLTAHRFTGEVFTTATVTATMLPALPDRVLAQGGTVASVTLTTLETGSTTRPIGQRFIAAIFCDSDDVPIAARLHQLDRGAVVTTTMPVEAYKKLRTTRGELRECVVRAGDDVEGDPRSIGIVESWIRDANAAGDAINDAAPMALAVALDNLSKVTRRRGKTGTTMGLFAPGHGWAAISRASWVAVDSGNADTFDLALVR